MSSENGQSDSGNQAQQAGSDPAPVVALTVDALADLEQRLVTLTERLSALEGEIDAHLASGDALADLERRLVAVEQQVKKIVHL